MNKENIIKELNFKATRSSGAGGQHVNKTSSKIELSFDLANANSLNENDKNILKAKQYIANEYLYGKYVYYPGNFEEGIHYIKQE